MSTKEELMDILKSRYGITSVKELEDAIRGQKRIDISVFVSDLKEEGRPHGS